jgi:LmbE family N-acetylglucosaminyl deacetylase
MSLVQFSITPRLIWDFRYWPNQLYLYLISRHEGRYQRITMTRRILVSLAHPDDEAFGYGPVIAKYVGEGAEVTLICATNGDVGSVDEQFMKGYNTVADLRVAELNCAAEVLGFKEVILFGYRDSGMMGSDDNKHPQSLWQAPHEEVTNRIIEVMRRIKPQVILTFDPYGGYGHPDHIKIHKATLAAYQALQPEAEHPQKLYYGTIPRLMIRVGLMIMRLRRQDPRKFGRNQDLDLQAVYDALLPIHTKIPIAKKYAEIGEKAAACHASQIGPQASNPIIRFVMKRALATNSLTRAYPEPTPGERIERDLFQGVQGI